MASAAVREGELGPDCSFSGSKCSNKASFQGLTEIWFHCGSVVNFPFQIFCQSILSILEGLVRQRDPLLLYHLVEHRKLEFIATVESRRSEETFKASFKFHSELPLYQCCVRVQLGKDVWSWIGLRRSKHFVSMLQNTVLAKKNRFSFSVKKLRHSETVIGGITSQECFREKACH